MISEEYLLDGDCRLQRGLGKRASGGRTRDRTTFRGSLHYCPHPVLESREIWWPRAHASVGEIFQAGKMPLCTPPGHEGGRKPCKVKDALLKNEPTKDGTIRDNW